MNIKVGDKVVFLNDVGGGVVTKIQDKKIAYVLTDEDFEIPVLISELVPDNESVDFMGRPASGQQKKQENIAAKEYEKDYYEEDEDNEDDNEIFFKDDDETNVYMAFVPVRCSDKTGSDLEIWLINDSNYHLFYSYMTDIENLTAAKTGILYPNTKEDIDILKHKLKGDLKKIHFQMIFYKESLFVKRPVFDKEIKINPTKFYKIKSFKENDFFDEKSIIIPLVEDNDLARAVERLTKQELEKRKIEKEAANRPRKPKKVEKNRTVEVDLHSHEILDDEKGLSAGEILEIQLEHFRNKMEAAIKDHSVAKIVFIHGVGNGKLKQEIRKELDKKYKKYRYQDASFQKYGFGATLVIIRRKT